MIDDSIPALVVFALIAWRLWLGSNYDDFEKLLSDARGVDRHKVQHFQQRYRRRLIASAFLALAALVFAFDSKQVRQSLRETRAELQELYQELDHSL
jgi:hypothetical protein